VPRDVFAMGAGATAGIKGPLLSLPDVSFEDWFQLMCDSAALAREPCFAVTCRDRSGSFSSNGTLEWASTAWCELMEYERADVVHKAFSQIRGLQGPLTSESSKLMLASLVISKERLIEGITVVNYTGQSRRPLELTLSVQVFTWQGLSVAFMCTVTKWAEVLAALPQEIADDAWQEWLGMARAHVSRREQPCLLVLSRHDANREIVDSANDVWLKLCEFEEADVQSKAFSEIPGLQGQLTSEASKLQLATLMLTEQKEVKGLRVVNYTARTRRPLEIQLDVRIFKLKGKNVAFLSSITRVVEIAGSASFEPEPEDQVEFSPLSAEECQDLEVLHAKLEA